MPYEPPQVSKYFRYDWQFAVEISRLPFLRPAALVIGFMPLITKASITLFGLQVIKVPPSVWVTWWSSVAFIASWTLLHFRCPQLIREYQDYGQYAQKQHSHRWVVWRFYHTIFELSDWQMVIRETLAKGLTVRPADSLPDRVYRCCPCFIKKSADSTKELFGPPPNREVVEIFYPINISRDIYVPIYCDGERHVLLMQEDDPKLAQKEKELFWLIFTEAAKEHPCCRVLFWCLFYISMGLLAFNVLNNVYLVLVQP